MGTSTKILEGSGVGQPVAEDVAGALFDSGAATSKAKRRRRPKLHPADVEHVDDDPGWAMIGMAKGVDSVAHLILTDEAGAGAYVLCGRVVGRVLPLAGAKPPACPECLRRRSNVVELDESAGSRRR